MSSSHPPRHYFSTIWVIASNSYREIIRDRLLYGILLIAVIVTSASFFLSTISLDQDSRVLFNTGLSAIHLFTFFICIFVATNSMAHDLEKRALYLLFSKPITRAQYIMGKYLSSLLLLLTTLFILGFLFTLGTYFLHREIVVQAVISLLYSFLEISLLNALAILFACFTAPLNATLYTTGLFIIGHSLETVRLFMAQSSSTPFIRHLVDVCYYLFPNLEKFNVRPALLYNVPIPSAQVGYTLLYWLVYSALAIGLAVAIIRKQEV